MTEMLITVVPLLAFGFALRSSRRGVARTTAVIALISAALVSVTLLGYLFWGNDWWGFTLRQKTIYSLEMIPPFAVYLAAFLAELPAFTRRWPLPRGVRRGILGLAVGSDLATSPARLDPAGRHEFSWSKRPSRQRSVQAGQPVSISSGS